MKKNFLFFAAFLMCFIVSMAQGTSQAEMPVEDRSKMFVDRISPKLNLTKGQKDSLATIFIRFMDDIQKYHAENNEKVFIFMLKTRDDKVKNLLRDSLKFDKYLLIMEEIKKQRETQHESQQQPPHGGQHRQMGGDRNF